MAKFELEVEHDFDFDLIGIACHAPDYRLCWSLNRLLELNLERSEKAIQTLHKDKTHKAAFPLFYFSNENDHSEYYLIVNKIEGEIFLTESKQADYLLMVKGLSSDEITVITGTLRKEHIVLTSFPINVNHLKNKEILLF